MIQKRFLGFNLLDSDDSETFSLCRYEQVTFLGITQLKIITIQKYRFIQFILDQP